MMMLKTLRMSKMVKRVRAAIASGNLRSDEPRSRCALRLNIPSDPANLAAARHAIEELALSGGFDATACGEIALCVNEALANVMRHAYAGATDRPIELSAELRDAREPDHAGECELLIRIRDWGSGVNPESLPQARRPKDPMTPGGLGLICLRSMMDCATFTPQPDGMLLEMRRRTKTKTRKKHVR